MNSLTTGTQKINLCKNLSSTVIFEYKNPRVCCSSTPTNVFRIYLFSCFVSIYI
nr:MAG TPA: hypothetical protein [Caudoviricetes sp.]